MNYPTPMDIAESEDRESDLFPSERLANICAALEEDLNESPFTREEWDRLDAERLELLAANDALAARLADAERDASYAQRLSIENELLRGRIDKVESALFAIRDESVIALNVVMGFSEPSAEIATVEPSFLPTK